jgi:hypothetical protein
MLPHVRVGEGYLCKATPHPFESLGRPLSPLPQGERIEKQGAKIFVLLQLLMLTSPPSSCRRLHIGSISAPPR